MTNVYFHNPNRRLFLQCISWLRTNGFTFVSADELLTILNGERQVPSGAVWVSFDDGWRDNMENVIPVVVECNIPVTFYISTNEVNDGHFWFSEARRLTDCLPEDIRQNIRQLWRVDESRRREIIDAMRRQRNYQNLDGTKREAMTQEDVAMIASLPQVTVGSHTANHAILSRCTAQEAEDELRTSKEVLEGWTGKQVVHFSYPNGEYSEGAKNLLPKIGYLTGATTEPRLGLETDDPFAIPRFHVMDDGSFAENLCHMLGFWFRVAAKARRALVDSSLT